MKCTRCTVVSDHPAGDIFLAPRKTLTTVYVLLLQLRSPYHVRRMWERARRFTFVEGGPASFLLTKRIEDIVLDDAIAAFMPYLTRCELTNCEKIPAAVAVAVTLSPIFIRALP